MFKGWTLRDLAFYYYDNVSEDDFPTFIHWVKYLRENDEF